MLTSPVIPDGEDDTSFKCHNTVIRSELAKKSKRNETVLNELIKQTFAMRRHDILESSTHAMITLQKYPFLREQDQVFPKITCAIVLVVL